MKQGVSTIIYPVNDIAHAKAQFSQLLGVQPYADQPYYVGFRVGDQEIGLDPNGFKNGMTMPIGYYQVNDIKQSLQMLLDAGGQVQQDIKDVGGGRQIAWVKDPDNNIIGLIHDA